MPKQNDELQMTIKEYCKRNDEKFILLSFDFAAEFTCWIEDEKVYMEEYGEGAFELIHIKTIDDYKKLYKLLTGNKMINDNL